MAIQKNSAADLAKQLEEIEAARKKVVELEDAERIARINATSARNELNELQKKFDQALEGYKKETQVHGTHWTRTS